MIFKQLKALLPVLRAAIKVLNASYSDILHKRKLDTCHNLGKSFGGFMHSESGEKRLFDKNAKAKFGLKVTKKLNNVSAGGILGKIDQ